jgi:hypothetical protein
LVVAFNVFAWRFASNAFKYPIKIGDAVEAAVVGNGGNTFVLAVGQPFAGLVDTDLVQEADKCMKGVFLEVPAESLRGHVCLAGNVFEGDRFVELLHDKIIDGADPDAFVFAKSDGM